MKKMRLGFKRGQKGFTLVEIIIVLAIMAVVAAIAVPQVTGYLSRGKERSYDADKEVIQDAVDAYFADKVSTWQGKAQYPIKAQDTTIDGSAGTGNPLKGQVGGSLLWSDDDTDGIRDAGEAWDNTTVVMPGPKTYTFTSGDFIIKMSLLVNGDYLKELPESASADNDAAGTGSYTWYIDANGKVQSLYYDYPDEADTDYTDFVDGVYP